MRACAGQGSAKLARATRHVQYKGVKRMVCQPRYRVAAGLIVLLLLLPAAVGSVSPAGAAGTTTLTFLGPDAA